MATGKRKRVDSAPLTPSKPKAAAETADRSARRKNTRRFIERTVAGVASDDEGSVEDELTEQLWGNDHADQNPSDAEKDEPAPPPQPPVKRGRGRPRKIRSPSPPVPTTLPPYEQFFWDNRPGANKTSNNTLTPHLLLNHDEYFQQQEAYEDPHTEQQEVLLELHESSFHQWAFELQNLFNICLYGYGSKRILTQSFAQFLHDNTDPPPKIVIVNGYTSTVSLHEILTTVASVLLPSHLKLPSIPATLLALILETLDSKPPDAPVYLLINSIDAVPLRRTVIQSALATLAAHKSIRFTVTADTPNFPLLWDVSLRSKFRFVFHDSTTFKPFSAEVDAVESVNELLGRSGRRLGGRDGVGYVLRSLPENARHLFRILVAEQIALGADGDVAMDDEEAEQNISKVPASTAGVEYRVIYHKAREELVCSTEHQLRTLLKEFYDHQMVESRRDGTGTELLIVPFRREELESLLEELVE